MGRPVHVDHGRLGRTGGRRWLGHPGERRRSAPRRRLAVRALALSGLVASLLASIAVIGPIPRAAAGTTTWSQLSPTHHPPAFAQPSMAYDQATSQMILVGSMPGDAVEETWLWTGTDWTQLSPATSPSPRTGAAMAYDATTQQFVLFGGASGGASLNDTWTWDASTWTKATPSVSPSARALAAMAYNPGDSNLVLYGGTPDGGTTALDDTWIWTTAGWSPVTANGIIPVGHWAAQLGYDSYKGTLFLHSGFEGGGGQYDDSFIWNKSASNWDEWYNEEPFCAACSASGSLYSPGARAGGGMAYDAATDQLIEFGGQSGSSLSSITWDYVSDSTVTVASSPAARKFPAMAYDGATGQLVLFGGDTGSGPVSETWTYGTPPTNPVVTATLSAASPTAAGVETVPTSAIPASSATGSGAAGTASGDPASAPLSSIPLSSIGLSSSPLSSIPLSSIPLSSIATPASGSPSGLAAAQAALGRSLLSDVSVTYPPGCGAAPAPACTGWPGILAGSRYAGVPLESVTLAQVLGDPVAGANLAKVNLGALSLASSPLSSIPLSSIELGAAPLSSIGLGGTAAGSAALSAWCGALAQAGSSCASFGISPTDTSTGVTLLALALAGVPLSSIPLSSIPLSSIPLSSIPLSSIPLSSINLVGSPLSSIPLSSIPLSSIPLSSIPLSSIPLSSINLVVDCKNNPSLCVAGSTTTLGQAAAAGALLTSATLGQLGTYGATTLGQLLLGDTTRTPGYPAITLGDLVVSTVPPTSYQWQSLKLSSLPLAAHGTAGGTVTYNAAITVANAPTALQVTATLPSSFAYTPGSTTIDNAPAADPATGAALTWTTPTLALGSHVLSFHAAAGIGLGPATTALAVTLGPSTVASSFATVDVVDGEQPQINSATTALPLVAGALNTSTPTSGNLSIGYLTAPGDLDEWAVTVAQGAELSLALTNLPAAYDLELFGPSTQPTLPAATRSIGGVTDTLPSVTPGATTEATPGSQDIPVTPPPGDRLLAVSTNPSGQSQFIQTPPLAAGTYIVQVSGYNGAFSAQPYLLQAELLGGSVAPTCPAGIPYLGALGGIAPARGPVAVPAGANTLFLVDTQRLSAAFPQQAAQIMTQLQVVASDAAAGVNGAVIPVDAFSTVQNAYASWNADPCSVDAANSVVAAIAAVVNQMRADHPTVQNLVVVGADDQIPMARVADGTAQSNERDYGASTFAGENNVEADALSLGYYFSDDPLSSANPLGVGSATLYTPELATGRLVESAAEIQGALNRFVQTTGNLNATAGLTTGYSFLSSGAQAVSANLAADGLTPSTLINESWLSSDLDAKLAATPTAGVVSLNAHFDYSRALPAFGNANSVTTNLFTTSDVRTPPVATSYAGRLLFSMGCHAGLSVSSAELGAGGLSTPVDDWTKTFADAGALWVANTGYGYADTDTIAYSARLMAGFAGDLNGSLSIGEALAGAKQQYAAGSAILSPYDLKALMESTFYGLPMYHLNTAGTPVAPPSGPPTVNNPIPGATGLTGAPVSLGLGQGNGTVAGQLSLVSTPNGSYYQVNGTTPTTPGTQTTEYRPIEPLVAVAATEPNLVPHGALVTGLQSIDTPHFQPAYSLPAVGSANSAPPAIGNAAFPGTLQRVATYPTFTATGTGQAAQLDLIAGQFLPDASNPGTGTQRLFTSMSAEVLYVAPGSPLATDYTPPTINSTNASTGANGLGFAIHVTPAGPSAPVTEVLVLSTDAANPGTWAPLLLSSTDGLTWTGTAPPTSSGNAQYIVQAVDTAGNVAVSNNEGADFQRSAPPAISISLSGNQLGGTYTGPVTASVTAPAGATYVLDGAPAAPVPSAGIVVSGSGGHTLTVTDPAGDRATRGFAISSALTTTALGSSANPSVVGQAVTYTATVAPATSGAGTPTGQVELLDGTTPIAACGGAAGTAISASGSAACTIAYQATGSHTVTVRYLGDTTFAGSSASLAQQVGRAPTTISVASSPNPSAVGQAVTLTATVAASSAGAGTPTGYVELLDGATPITACGGTTGTALSTTGTATCTAALSGPGAHTIAARYAGDPSFTGSTTTLNQQLSQATTTTTLTSSVNPSSVGQTVTFAATVAAAGGATGTPTGAVEYLDGTTPIAACGGAAGATLSATGAATCTTTLSTAGFHPISAVYLGDGNDKASTATVLAQIVTRTACRTLAGCHLDGLDLRGANLGGANLAGASLILANLSGANLAGANLTGANLSGANLSGANLTGANLTGALLIATNLGGANLSGANLSGATLAGANLASANLSGANLTGAIAAGANLRGAILHGANLTGANLTLSSLVGADLTAVTATGASMLAADLTGVNATGANLSGVNASGANLTNANFTNANLSGANLHGANVTGANFTGANLTGVRH